MHEIKQHFQKALDTHAAIIPDFWTSEETEYLFGLCQIDYNIFSKLKKTASKETYLMELNNRILSYHASIAEHEERFIETQSQPGKNKYASWWVHWKAWYHILISFAETCLLEEDPFFNTKLLEVVTKALREKELLTLSGKYTGMHAEVRALYEILIRRGYILGAKKKEERFASWFKENFGFSFSGRILRTAVSNERQKELETDFKTVIPEKK